jgi:hypothetical protein
MSAASWKQKLAKFWGLSGPDKWMLIHAAVWLALARLLLLVMPFRRLAGWLSDENASARGLPDPELLERIGYAVRAAANNVPWRSDCFPQSIAAWIVLKHYGFTSTIHLGVEHVGEVELSGHAWLTCGDTVVTGGAEFDRYAETLRLGALSNHLRYR